MTSRTAVVARKDFEDAVRSKMLWSLMGLLVAIVALIYLAVWWNVDDPGATDIVGIAGALMQLLVPLVALIAGYLSVVGERQSGSIKILLSLPPNRRQVVFGKLFGRSAVIACAVTAAFAALVLLGLLFFQALPLVDFLGIAAASVLVGFAFVGIAVGISAMVASRGRAMAGVIGLYLIFLLFWDLITAAVYRVLRGELPGNPGDQFEAWYVFLQWLNPIEAYGVLTDAILGETFGAFTIPIFAPQDVSATERVVAGEVPAYLQEPVLVPVLLFWFVVPVALGYLRFRRADLG
ncbi:MAG: ABC transporter permease subunit [Halovenus sp.]